MTIDYYRQQSRYTDPRQYASYLSAFPHDYRFIVDCIQHLFLHYADVDLFCMSLSQSKFSELNSRYLHKILANMIAYDAHAFVVPRKPENRVMGICRDSALLFCAILRHLNIPARLRAGYVTYFIPGLYLDSVLVEFYDPQKKSWVLVDTRTSQQQINHYHLNIDFDLMNVPPDKFISAANAWNLCRNHQEEPARFGSRQSRGLKIIRNRLMQDLAFLNKEELLVWDIWGGMFDPLNENDVLMHSLAELLLDQGMNFKSTSDFYHAHATLQVPEKVYVDNPFLVGYWENLN